MDSLPSSLNSSKRLKEEFVSNLTGSSILEVAAVLTNVSILILLRHSVSSDRLIKDVSLKKSDDENLSSKDWRAYITTLAADFLVIVLPAILFLTVLSDWTYIWTISLMTLLFFICAAKGSCSHSPPFEPGVHSLKSVLSSYRFSVMIGTCLCIMAVDFRIFPRKYAKTETYGTSLVHVSEYGVHWNFFFTLAAVSILTSIINVPPSYSGILGSLVLVGYQICLIYGLNLYLLSSERGTNIISQNKEGIFSIFGYWGMYLLGVQLGNYLFFGNHSSAMLRSNGWARVWIPMLLFWTTTVLLDRYVEGVSRRTCNLPYVTMVLALNLQVLSVLTLSDYIPGSKTSILEQAFNRNLLGSFLLANVLTGLVNLSVDTLSASSVAALFILVLYASVLTIVVGIADFCCIRLKFW
ncbi:hypothetical protein I3760_12G062800 [Carya illinoinensis]|nr:hypothetical protein I3760_12G062800 [Carya illinoinensis]